MGNENENNDFSVDGKHLKDQTTSTFKDVRDTIKGVDIKKDTAETKGFLLDYFKNPIKKIQEIATAGDSYFKIAIVFMIIWTATVLVRKIYNLMDMSRIADFFRYGLIDNILAIVLAVITPMLGVVIMAVIIMIFNKSTTKTLSELITVVAIAKVPSIIAAVISLLTIISYDMHKITGPIASFCQMLATVLLYFGIRATVETEDDHTFIKMFMKIIAVYYVAAFVLSFLGINL